MAWKSDSPWRESSCQLCPPSVDSTNPSGLGRFEPGPGCRRHRQRRCRGAPGGLLAALLRDADLGAGGHERLGEVLGREAADAVNEQVRSIAAGLAGDREAADTIADVRRRDEARLDLHGMTLAAAHPQLIGFILSSHAQGRRLVLVITGKGRGDHGPLPTRPGALRHQVPHWLHMQPLAPVVQQVTAAHYRHGGEGAYYVYLRRRG